MPRVPDTDAEFLTFARERADIWAGGQSGPPIIGLSAQQISDTEAATAAAEAADAEARNLRNLSKAATIAKRAAFANLEQVIGADIDTIDAYAKATKDPLVYQKAQIDPPKEPSERPAPPQPTVDLPVMLTNGRIRVDFTVAAGGGAQYQIQRRDTPLGGQAGSWVNLNTVAEKFYVDEAVPTGLLKVEYQVRAQISSGAASDWSLPAPFDFGSQGSAGGPQATGRAGSILPVKGEDQKGAG